MEVLPLLSDTYFCLLLLLKFFYTHHGFLLSVEKSVILSTAEQFLINSQTSDKEGLNRGYLDNTKHFIFGLCNMKQLNFRHFNTNRIKFFETVNFFQKEAKTPPKRPILFCLYQGVFSHFTTIPDYFRRFPKATDDSRRLSQISKDQRRGPTIVEDVRRTLQTLNSIFFGNSKH